MVEVQNPMLALFDYIKKYRSWFVFASLSTVVNTILDMMPPLLVGWIIASVSGQAPEWIRFFVPSAEPMSMAIFLTILTVVIFTFESLSQWMYGYGFMTLAQRAQHDLRMDTYNKIQSREIAFFENHRLGETMAMLNDDVNQLEQFLNIGLREIINLIIVALFAALVLFQLSWPLALVGMAPVPFIMLGSIVFQRWLAPRYKKVREMVGYLSTRLENNLSGIMVIKSFTAEKFESQRVNKVSEDYKQANYRAIKVSTLFVPVIRMGVVFGFAGVLLIGSYWVLDGGKHNLTVATLVTFTMMIERFLWPMTRLGVIFDEYARAKASAGRTFGLLRSESPIQEVKNLTQLAEVKGQVTFEKVSFEYNPNMSVLNKMAFDIKAGETIGIAGQTGAGKSTLIKLLLRLYDVTDGAVKLDGIDIKEIALKELRHHIALVTQDVYLFQGTIAENIAYGLPEIAIDKVYEVAKIVHMHDFIESLPSGYDTLVGERGIKLSGGQRQRLSIARAILKDAPIIILDEATSAVDTETEQAIQENFSKLTQGKTAIIIAHRLSTIREADRIFVLSQGQIVEQGQHDALLKQGGLYADLWSAQVR